MNTGQTMLILGAMAILSVLTLSINSSIVNATVFGFNMEVNLDAISIAQSLMDEVLSNDFDQNTINNTRAYAYTDITPIGSLGPDGASEYITGGVDIEDTTKVNDFQSKSKFNDVDDYKGYKRKAWNPRLGWFTDSASVAYVRETDPDIVALSPTFYKRISITVTHPNMIMDRDQKIIPMIIKDLSVYRRYF